MSDVEPCGDRRAWVAPGDFERFVFVGEALYRRQVLQRHAHVRGFERGEKLFKFAAEHVHPRRAAFAAAALRLFEQRGIYPGVGGAADVPPQRHQAVGAEVAQPGAQEDAAGVQDHGARARFGGELDAADKIRTLLLNTNVPTLVFINNNAASAGALISIACDRAKYACDKQRGTFESGWYVFDAEMLTQLDGVRYIINHLDQALSERWIKVCYQPIIRAVNGRVCDEEALSRWVDPVHGTLSPAVFIPILERARLIYKLDLYVLDQILEKMQAQKLARLQVVPHSVPRASSAATSTS